MGGIWVVEQVHEIVTGAIEVQASMGWSADMVGEGLAQKWPDVPCAAEQRAHASTVKNAFHGQVAACLWRGEREGRDMRKKRKESGERRSMGELTLKRREKLEMGSLGTDSEIAKSPALCVLGSHHWQRNR